MRRLGAAVLLVSLTVATPNCAYANRTAFQDPHSSKTPLVSIYKDDDQVSANYNRQVAKPAPPVVRSSQRIENRCRYDDQNGAIITPNGQRVELDAFGIGGKVIDHASGKDGVTLLTQDNILLLVYCEDTMDAGAVGSVSMRVTFRERGVKTGKVINEHEIIAIFTNGDVAKVTLDPETRTAVSDNIHIFQSDIKKEQNPRVEVYDSTHFLLVLPSSKKAVVLRMTDESTTQTTLSLAGSFGGKSSINKIDGAFQIRFDDGSIQTIRVAMEGK
ncbi:Uncharacterised protein [Candidatus Bilamarchaeum dharawalense]|uniref:Uncharacterized protein n=1 Tax=Candidatus Bilamarchaeum dharawalense TaxID=2885759 RepID=A0A5E4LN74_9ARCH|nr:Uncharacterised protein [Candidatus Bilamarchaeum dharawalense]